MNPSNDTTVRTPDHFWGVDDSELSQTERVRLVKDDRVISTSHVDDAS